MGRLLEIARAALAETEPQDARQTDTGHLPLIRTAAPITGRLVEDFEERPCWHCGGSGRCGCVTCGRFEPHLAWQPGPCKPCGIRKHARVQ